MAVSQNGWPVITSGTDKRLVNFPLVTGKVRAGDVFTVLEWFAAQWNTTVEPLRRDWSWGWNYRPIRGGSSWSNHASGTCFDGNAPRHPLGVSPNKTMNAKQRARMRQLIKLSGGVLRWGGDYPGRKDTMHVEINASAAAVSAFAAKIRSGKVETAIKPTGSVPAPVKPTPAPSKPSAPKPAQEFPAVALVVDGVWKERTTRAYQLMLRDAAGTYRGAIDYNFGELSVKAEQTWLKKLGYYKGEIHGKRDEMTKVALSRFLKAKGLRKAREKNPDNHALQRYINSQRKYIRR